MDNLFGDLDEDLLEIEEFLRMDEESDEKELIYLKDFDEIKNCHEELEMPIWPELFWMGSNKFNDFNFYFYIYEHYSISYPNK